MTKEEKERILLLKKFDNKHIQNFLKQKKVLDLIYDSLAKEAARIGKSSGFDDADAEFHFEDYPQTLKLIDKLVADFADKIETTIQEGNKREWLLSNDKNTALITSLATSTGIDKKRIEGWTRPNLDALQAFQERKRNGMGLSDNVWKVGRQVRQELELALDVGLGEGKSAAALSRDVRQYLDKPDMLFRRVRDKHGNLRLSKAAEAFHPGQGTYRSSYKNALRMTATENNMAYRTADHEKWGNLDFIIGQKIQLSNNHTIKNSKGVAVPFHDICDEMVGDYPKDFKFTGWHPFCRCIVTPILADWNEVLENMDNPDHHYEGEITDMPEGYNKWIEDNADRIERAKSLPYWIKDNYVGGSVGAGLIWEKEKKRATIFERAEMRHNSRTPEQIQDIKDRWALREDEMQYSPEQRAMFREIEKTLGIKRGFSMPHLRADMQNANPNYGKNKGFGINCQTCSPAYMLRRMGFDVTAKANTKGSLNEYLSAKGRRKEAWHDITGKGKAYQTFDEWMHKKGYKQMSEKRYKEYFAECNNGVYELGLSWKGGGGHRTVIEKHGKKIRYIEPQVDNSKYSNRYWNDFGNLCKEMTVKPNFYDGAMKVDDAIFNIKKFAPIFDINKAVPLHTQRVLNNAAIRHEARSVEEIKNIKAAWAARRKENEFRMQIQKIKEIPNLKLLTSERSISPRWVGYTDDANKIKLMRKAYIERAAELRHASRNDADVKQRYAEYRKRIELQRKTAENIVKVANDYPYVDASILNDLLAKNRTIDLVAETKRIAKEMSAIKKWENAVGEYIPNIKTLEKQFSQSEITAVKNNVVKNLAKWENNWNTDPWLPKKYVSKEDYLLHKLSTELTYVSTSGKLKYATWKVANKAYTKQIEIINDKIWLKGAEAKVKEMQAFAIAHPKSKKFFDELIELEDAYKIAQTGDKNAWNDAISKIEARKHSMELSEARRAKSKTVGTIDFKLIDKKEAQRLFDEFELEYSDIADSILRPQAKDSWKLLTDEEKLILTKYTQTYHYLNEPMRGMMYSGGRTRDEFTHDMPLLESAISKMKMKEARVVRRGTADFPIPALGKKLSNVKPGDEFVDGGFLSTAVKTNGGFSGLDIRIIVPKGAEGFYVEPLSHYNDHCGVYDWEKNQIWDGVTDVSFGTEREWTGQHGCKFKVLEVKGNTVYLQIIGQRYNQVDDPLKYFY